MEEKKEKRESRDDRRVMAPACVGINVAYTNIYTP